MRVLFRPAAGRQGQFGAPLVDDDARKAAPAFSPLQLSFLEEYYDSRFQVGVQGSNVVTAVDLSGHSPIRDEGVFPIDNLPTLNVTANLTPLLKQNIAFNGVDQSLITGTINPMPNPNTRGYSFHIYGNFVAGVTGVIWQDDTGLRPQLLVNINGGTIGWRDTTATQAIAGATAGWRLFSWCFDLTSGLCSCYQNGVLLGSAAWQITYNLSAATISSCNQSLNAHLAWRRGFTTWYSASHTAVEVALFNAWVTSVWGY